MSIGRGQGVLCEDDVHSAGVWGVLCEVWMVCCRGRGVRKWSKYVKCLILCLYNQIHVVRCSGYIVQPLHA